MAKIQQLAAGPDWTDDPHYTQLPHVLLVVDGFPKALGGGERILLRLAALLPQYGFRASILTFSFHPQSSFRPTDTPCPLYLLPLTNTYGWQALRGAMSLRALLKKEQVRIVHTFFESSDIWAGVVTRLLSSAKLVWSRRDMGILRSPKHTRAYRMLRRFPHAVFAVSAKVARHVEEVDGVLPSKVHVIHNGLDLENHDPSRTEARLQRHGHVITTIGNIRKVKGHDLLLQAAAEVVKRFPDACFTVAGGVLEPEFYAQLQRDLVVLNLTENFEFLGNISDLGSHLKTADLFVLPSRSEGFSNALIEAMAHGLPCVATDVGGNAEAIVSGTSGLIVPPEDADALANALVTLLADHELASRLGSGARHSVEANFTSAAMLRKVTEAFSALLR